MVVERILRLRYSRAGTTPSAEMSERIVGLLYQLLRDIIKQVLIKAALINVRLCHYWVRTG